MLESGLLELLVSLAGRLAAVTPGVDDLGVDLRGLHEHTQDRQPAEPLAFL